MKLEQMSVREILQHCNFSEAFLKDYQTWCREHQDSTDYFFGINRSHPFSGSTQGAIQAQQGQQQQLYSGQTSNQYCSQKKEGEE